VRRPTVVASVALIAVLATVAVPSPVGSRAPTPISAVDPGLFQAIDPSTLPGGTTMTIQPLDPMAASAANLDRGSSLLEPDLRTEPNAAPVSPVQPAAHAKSMRRPGAGSPIVGGWHQDREISWYGPGFYGNGTACGQTLTKTLIGVAHRSLPCGTLVTFRYQGRTLTVPVVDRGPYVAGRTWDLTGGACIALGHCFTGPIEWRLGS
jgi:rare lipoprotein A (RlpA)-like double-psi beta-barrel protein